MRYRYYIVDVFTETLFGGNQLAVLPDAQGLDSETMQKIAREFNFSETTFVLPPMKPQNTHHVRIFTPASEIPFAGHPNVGTAFALVAMDDEAIDGNHGVLRFEEQAGLVEVAVTMHDEKPVYSELTAPQEPQLGPELNTNLKTVANMLSLYAEDIATENHLPRSVSVGLPMNYVELASCDALARSRIKIDLAEQLLPNEGPRGVMLYTFDGGDMDVDVRARMYAPLGGVPEDPATGSAAGALAGLLATLDERENAELSWRIAQGVEMGRPSLIEAKADKRDGEVSNIRVGGSSVMVSEGWIDIPE